MSPSCAANYHPSMLYLVGEKDWVTLRKLVKEGAYDDIVSDKAQMSIIIAFAVNLRAPAEILHQICQLNPDALTVGNLPFRLARLHGSGIQSTIVLEAARQQAVVNRFNSSSSSLRSLADAVDKSANGSVIRTLFWQF